MKPRNQHKPTVDPPRSAQRRRSKVAANPPSGIKRWRFRIAAMLLPLVFLLGLELALRAVGYGYPTSFLLNIQSAGKKLLVQNDRFGWQFFGQKYARCPETFAITPKAPADTVRIVLLGGSAAVGDPKPDFGLPIMLDAMLSLRYPSTNFEVVNVAMTAINSHVIREIARDCRDAALEQWSRAAKLQPMFGAAHLGMGQASEAQGQVDVAYQHYMKALQGQFYESEELARLGRVFSRKGWYQEALKSLQYAVALSPSDADISYDLAVVLKKLGRDAESADQLAVAQQYGPSEWRLRFESGLELAKQGNMKAAEEEFRAVVRLKPDMMEGRLNLGGALLEQGLMNEAAYEFSQAVRLSPTNTELLDFLESIGFQLDTTGDQ